MLPIICVVGASDSGKTTYIEKLIPELTRRGYRVGTIKHDVHGFEMDREGKDTWRHRRAGAQTIAISSPSQVATIRGTGSEIELEELVGRYFWLEDVIVAEGFKRSHYPKIEIFRTAVEPAPICGLGDNLIAVVTDDQADPGVPVFRFSQVEAVADLVEDRYLKPRRRHRVMIQLDGKTFPVNDFVKDFVGSTVQGMLSSLRGWKQPGMIEIRIRLEDD